MEWISVKDRLPENGQYVLAWAYDGHREAPMYTVVRFVAGISKGTRKELEKIGCCRAREIHAEDEFGNNKVAYYWDEFGPKKWFGQDVTHWIPLPEPPTEQKRKIVIDRLRTPNAYDEFVNYAYECNKKHCGERLVLELEIGWTND